MSEEVAVVRGGRKPSCTCGVCRKCVAREKHKEYRNANRETFKAYWRKYRATHLEKKRAASRADHQLHRVERNAASARNYRNNKARYNAQSRAWAEAHPEATKAAHLRRLYRLPHERYMQLLTSQRGACAICCLPETDIDNRTGKPRALAVDHDRKCCPGKTSCGKCVRGLLCGKCNKAVGLLMDSPLNALAAYAYLRISQELRVVTG